MELLADENVESEWIQALRDDGHDVVRVVDVEDLGVSASDLGVLAVATRKDRVLLTADQSDFSNPPADEHPGIIIIADVTRTGGEVITVSHYRWFAETVQRTTGNSSSRLAHLYFSRINPYFRQYNR
ncbi:MAG: DUF5615 family PIN-like protein [Haloferacaceae archaeon]